MAFRLYVPQVGTKLALCEDWKTVIHKESRNMKFLEALGFSFTNDNYVQWNKEDLSKLTGIPMDELEDITGYEIFGYPPSHFNFVKTHYIGMPQWRR